MQPRVSIWQPAIKCELPHACTCSDHVTWLTVSCAAHCLEEIGSIVLNDSSIRCESEGVPSLSSRRGHTISACGYLRQLCSPLLFSTPIITRNLVNNSRSELAIDSSRILTMSNQRMSISPSRSRASESRGKRPSSRSSSQRSTSAGRVSIGSFDSKQVAQAIKVSKRDQRKSLEIVNTAISQPTTNISKASHASNSERAGTTAPVASQHAASTALQSPLHSIFPLSTTHTAKGMLTARHPIRGEVGLDSSPTPLPGNLIKY